MKLVECVPNFSEGRDMSVIKQITDVIESVENVKLLDVDPGKSTNRTVVTFAGTPEAVIDAAFLAIQKAAEVIDMRNHKGEHPRMGATDVCPFIPISGVTMEECVKYSKILAERVGRELNISVFLYEYSSSRPALKALPDIRTGEYEKMAEKLATSEFTPDFGPKKLNEKAGVTAIGARDFLIAYNVNLNTTSVRRANSVAFDVRENGRAAKDANGNDIRQEGACKAVAGIGWYIPEYGVAQVSMNLKNIRITPIHIAFDECCKSAERRGMRVTGSELVGLIPLQSMLDAGSYFLKKQQRSVGVSDDELIKIAVKTMGLDELAPFDPKKKIIEYVLADAARSPLINMTLTKFADETASESPAPGGGSISAYVGALGAALAGMVANLSSHKRGWDDRWEEFSEVAREAQDLKNALLRLVDEDTNSFNKVMDAFGLSKDTDEAKKVRKQAIQDATRYATEIPFTVMQKSLACFGVIQKMAEYGNPNSITDAGVGALCVRAAVHGAFLNVQINASGLDDKAFANELLEKGKAMIAKADEFENQIIGFVKSKI